MKIYYVCLLTVLSVVLMILWLVAQYHRANRGTEERLGSVQRTLEDVSARLGRLEEKQRKDPEGSPEENGNWDTLPEDGPLTAAGVAECVRAAGYVPEDWDGGFIFKKDDEVYIIDLRRLPRVFISKTYLANPKDWDLELLQRAAYQMSDEIIMLKADISGEPDGDGDRTLRFFLAAMDRTLRGFRENLKEYIQIIDEGQRRMGEAYNQFEKEKKDASSLNGLTSSSDKQNGKTPS